MVVFKFELMQLACTHNVGALNSNANLNWVSILNEELKSQYSNTHYCSSLYASMLNLLTTLYSILAFREKKNLFVKAKDQKGSKEAKRKKRK